MSPQNINNQTISLFLLYTISPIVPTVV
jgi:hypothetical protein